MILTAKALLDENPNPTKQEARQAISGNVCRCTGYAKIVEAMLRAGDGLEVIDHKSVPDLSRGGVFLREVFAKGVVFYETELNGG